MPKVHPTGLDAYKPAEIADLVENAGVAKAHLSFVPMITLSILAGAIIWPISAFVLLGLEHSIANMYLIPQGLFAGATITLSAFAYNLLFVTIGNIIGGAGGVALAYRLAYGPHANN